MLFAITSYTWIVTGLGFGIVLALLFCLVFIMQFFGWTMQKMTAPHAPKKAAEPVKVQPAATAPTNEEKGAIATTPAKDGNDDLAAVAYALYLAHNSRHDLPSPIIRLSGHETAWNEKTYGLNNKGF